MRMMFYVVCGQLLVCRNVKTGVPEAQRPGAGSRGMQQ